MGYKTKNRLKTPLQHLQNDYGQLGRLQQHCQQLKTIEKSTCRYLADELHPHYEVLNYRAGVLVLKTQSSAWATRLRFQIPHLLRSLRREKAFRNLVSIDVVVRPENEAGLATQPQHNPTLTPAAKSSLQQCAETLAEGKLKTLIDKMSK